MLQGPVGTEAPDWLSERTALGKPRSAAQLQRYASHQAQKKTETEGAAD